ncbi:hypothetical protein BH10ACI4_BH10ACI4_31750 [soil metagenome]
MNAEKITAVQQEPHAGHHSNRFTAMVPGVDGAFQIY